MSKKLQIRSSRPPQKSKENEQDDGVMKSDFDRLVLNAYLNQNAHKLASEDDEVLFALRVRRDRDRRTAVNSLAASMLSSGQKKNVNRHTEHVAQPKPRWMSKLRFSILKPTKFLRQKRKLPKRWRANVIAKTFN